jgi:outer membrane protein OmpA-like peptidoglycan-associated protein
MKPSTIHLSSFLCSLGLVSVLTALWVGSASSRLMASTKEGHDKNKHIAVASVADEGYCTKDLKQILKRVLTSCGLVKADKGHGCQPLEAKNVAAMSGDDFNSLFKPLKNRAAIIQFDKDKFDLDEAGNALLTKTFTDQRGASYFLVVARASPEGSETHNRELSEKRANTALAYLNEKFHDPDLEQEVGLLWLGEEFAQLAEEYCQWNRSRKDDECTTTELNRSAFVAWIDCQL